MLVGIVSDIHGNDAGLEAACRALRSRGAEQIICCGDLVGYSARVREVLATVRRESMICVAGNHDAMVTNRSWPAQNALKSRSLAYAAKTLGEDDRAWLAALPLVRDWRDSGASVRMLHGMPSDPLEGYFYPHLAMEASLPDGVDYLVVGHTHMQFRAAKERGAILNPGSCGLPRDGDPRAACMLLDTVSGAATALRVLYDPADVLDANAHAGFSPALEGFLLAGQETPLAPKDDALHAAAALLESEGMKVVPHLAGFIAASAEVSARAVLAMRLSDGTTRIRSTPIAYYWESSAAESPPGFAVSRSKVALWFEMSSTKPEAEEIAHACRRILVGTENS